MNPHAVLRKIMRANFALPAAAAKPRHPVQVRAADPFCRFAQFIIFCCCGLSLPVAFALLALRASLPANQKT
jgi:hypothetical protein